MLDFGFSEILLTSAIALVVLGPERLPKVARQVGNWMGRARAMARQLGEQLEREVSADELLRDQSKPKAATANRIAPPQYVPPDPHTPLPDSHAVSTDMQAPQPMSGAPATPAADPHAPLPDSHAASTDMHAPRPMSSALANPAADPHSAPGADSSTSTPPNE
jgi:sec-independent protein translocase protein TatB